MLPNALIVRNYRSFAGQHTLPLRRLTLVFGDNNAGKSALVRALPLLAASAQGNHAGVLALGSPATSGGGFSDLRCRFDVPSGDPQDMALGLAWNDDALREFRIDFTRSQRIIRARRIGLGADPIRTLKWVPYPDSPLRFIDEDHGRDDFEVPFIGLRPQPHEDQPPEIAKTLKLVDERLATFGEALTWVSGVRATPTRRRSQPGGAPTQLSHDGDNAPDFLFVDDEVRSHVSKWYSDHLDREIIITEEPPDDYRITLLAAGDRPVVVDLLDCGLGPIQVFPILVALESARGDSEPRLLVLEEPESHLHPALQRDLALHVAEFISGTSHQVIVETHSRAFFLGVQLALIEGKLSPDDVLAVVVQSRHGRSEIDSATFDEMGYPDRRWPPGFFTDDQRLARDILLARRGSKA